MNAALLSLFWLTQILANILFKHGGNVPDRWIWCFLGASCIGLGSNWLVMRLYENLSPVAVLCLTGGGTFLLLQVSMAVMTKSWPAPLQWAGILAVTLGMVVASMGQLKPE